MLKKGTIKERTQNLLLIIVVRKEILLICVGARLQIRMSSLKTWLIITSATRKVNGNMNVELRPSTHKDLKDIVTTIKSTNIEILSADPNPCGHQTGKKR